MWYWKRKNDNQVRKLNMLFLFEQIGFLSSKSLYFFEDVQICKEETTAKKKKILLNNCTQRNYTKFVSINGAKVTYGCVDAGCTEFVEDGVQWRNFAIKVKILQVVVMTRNFHDNSKGDFVPYWLDVAVTGVHAILMPTSLLSGLVRY